MTTHTVDLKFKIVREGAHVPEYKSEGAVGADLRAHLSAITKGDHLYQQVALFNNPEENCVCIPPGETRLIPTGICIELPPFYEAQVRSRSGTALKQGLIILNTPGTIDWDYRGEIFLMMHNTSKDNRLVTHGDRIAQLVISPVVRGMFHETKELSTTLRDSGAFGSSGVK